MEKDVVEAIETTAPRNNEGKEDNIFPVELVDKVERFYNRYRDGNPVTIRYQYLYNNNKSQSGSLFYLRERTNLLSQHQHHGRNGSANKKRYIYKVVKQSPATATTKKTKGTKRKSEQQQQ